jgi:hypothetical protein
LFGASGVTDISIVSPSIPSPFSAPFLIVAEDWSFSPVASNYNFEVGFKVALEFDHGAITVKAADQLIYSTLASLISLLAHRVKLQSLISIS